MSSQEERPKPRWQMKKDCVFVDAYKNKQDDLSVDKRLPEEILPYAHVMNKVEQSEPNRDVVKLNDVAAFIMRFIALGVDTEKHLPDIVYSEYDGELSMEFIEKDIKRLEQQMEALGYIERRKPSRVRPPDPNMDEFPVTHKNYDLEAGVHSFGPTIIRLPR